MEKQKKEIKSERESLDELLDTCMFCGIATAAALPLAIIGTVLVQTISYFGSPMYEKFSKEIPDEIRVADRGKIINFYKKGSLETVICKEGSLKNYRSLPESVKIYEW